MSNAIDVSTFGGKIVSGKIKKFLPNGVIVERDGEELTLGLLKETVFDGDIVDQIYPWANTHLQAVVDQDNNMIRLRLWKEREEE